MANNKKNTGDYLALLKKNWAVAGSTGLILLIILILLGREIGTQEIDERFCRTNGHPGATLVLVDGSYAWNEKFAADVIATIENVIVEDDEFARHDFLRVGWLGIGSDPSVQWSEFQYCNPGRRDQVGGTVDNPDLAERKFKNAFVMPLVADLETRLDRESQSQESELLAALDSVANQDLDLKLANGEKGPGVRIVLFSPMIQHNPGQRTFCPARTTDVLVGAEADFSDGAKSVIKNARVEVFPLPVGLGQTELNSLKREWDGLFGTLNVMELDWRDADWRTAETGDTGENIALRPAYPCPGLIGEAWPPPGYQSHNDLTSRTIGDVTPVRVCTSTRVRAQVDDLLRSNGKIACNGSKRDCLIRVDGSERDLAEYLIKEGWAKAVGRAPLSYVLADVKAQRDQGNDRRCN